jgi:hypothetical protein
VATLIQVCNVAEVMGGTGACAWTVTRALPGWRHVVVFPRAAREEVAREFGPAEVRAWPVVTAARVREVAAESARLGVRGGVVVLLHNAGVGRVEGTLPAVVLQYVHSPIRAAGADSVRYCSQHLAARCGVSETAWERAVLYQAVPEPPRGCALGGSAGRGESSTRSLRRELVVGRLCTPTARKWPEETIAFTRRVAEAVPGVRWEFVGCPEGLQCALGEACAGEATFHPASWAARGHLWNWDALVYHHPSLTETFGRVVAEALRAGCVPVVDARGGFVEQVTPETGFLCSGPEEFVRAVRTLRDDRVLRWRMSGAARERGRALFGEEAMARRLVGWVREAAAEAAQVKGQK